MRSETSALGDRSGVFWCSSAFCYGVAKIAAVRAFHDGLRTGQTDGRVETRAKNAIPVAGKNAAELRHAELAVHFGVTATFYVEFQAIALLHREIDRQSAVLLPERQDFRIGQKTGRIVRRHFVWRLTPLSGEGRASLRRKPDHRFRKNFGRPLAAGLLGENVENGLGELGFDPAAF
jgi:hypothetical protein